MSRQRSFIVQCIVKISKKGIRILQPYSQSTTLCSPNKGPLKLSLFYQMSQNRSVPLFELHTVVDCEYVCSILIPF